MSWYSQGNPLVQFEERGLSPSPGLTETVGDANKKIPWVGKPPPRAQGCRVKYFTTKMISFVIASVRHMRNVQADPDQYRR